MHRKRLIDIDIATGIAIILVVIGHLASRSETGIEAYVNLKRVIYKFHMPLFLCLSGYIAYYTYHPIKSFKGYIEYEKKKFFRIFPAYVILAITFFIGKYVFVENTDIEKSLLNILVCPSESDSGYLWYIYVLFLYYLCMPIIDYMICNKFLIFFIIVLALSSFVPFPKLFSLDIFFWYLPFFMFGCYVVSVRESSIPLLRRYGFAVLILFSLWGVFEFLQLVNIPKNIVGFFAIVSVIYLSSIKIIRNSFLEKMGGNSFYIYLFNTMFIGFVSEVLVKLFGKEEFYNMFYYFAPFLIIIGLFLPILLHKYIISRIPILKSLIK